MQPSENYINKKTFLCTTILFSFLSLLTIVNLASAFDIKQAAAVQAQTAQGQPKAAAVNIDAVPLSMILKKTAVQQGQYFEVDITGAEKNPLVWFNSESFLAFKVGDKAYKALVPVENLTKPGSYVILARTGGWEERIPVKVLDNRKPIQYIYLDPDKSSLEATNKEINEISSAFRLKTEEKYAQGKFSYPSRAVKSSPFGVKRSYNKGPVDSYHKGLDFAGNMGSPVFAPADGKVALTGLEKDGFQVHGNTILIDHGHALSSIYLHLSKIDVKKGDMVIKGQKIGEVGHTGISTGPHLHWGTYLYGTSVDPELFVKGD
jgi:murein DD-endopeptidase MepM/ murein hydrolase activator NlpD